MKQFSKSEEKPCQIFFNSNYFGTFKTLEQEKEKDSQKLKEKIEAAFNEEPGFLYSVYKKQKDIYQILPADIYFPPPLGRTIVFLMKIHNQTEGKNLKILKLKITLLLKSKQQLQKVTVSDQKKESLDHWNLQTLKVRKSEFLIL
jgi:hypothetical protein